MSKTPSPKTTHKAIFEYWKDKAISEDGHIYIDYGYEGCDEHLLSKVKSEAVVYDWGEPRCFACGISVGAEDNPDYAERLKASPDGSSVWTYKEVKLLQKCHIIPRALGGEDTPKNLFLLCERCHKESPDTIYKEQFFRWCYERKQKPKHSVILFNSALDVLKKTYGINIPKFSKGIGTKEHINANIGQHGGGKLLTVL